MAIDPQRPDALDPVASAAIGLDKTIFFNKMISELAGTIEAVVGVEQASGYVAAVGATIGEWLNAAYHAELGPDDFDMEALAAIFVDLKARIDGGFFVKSVDADTIVLGNTRCPFGKYVLGRPSLCQMTSNVFGRIAADNVGYARVKIERAIAQGHEDCHVIVQLRNHSDVEPDEREYYRVPDLALG